MKDFYVFPGGIHPKEGVNGKEVTSKKKVEVLDPPARVVIPLQQHIGAPSKCIVQKGDKVKMGQCIAEAGGFVSARIHSSVSGTVVSIGKCIVANGTLSNCVVINNDFKDTWVSLNPCTNIDSLDKAKLLDIIKDCGVVGLGGATFPTHVKISSADGADVLVINGAECEPYLSADHLLMLEYSDKIIKGIQLLLKVLGIKKAIVGIEKNKQDVIDILTKESESIDNIKVKGLEVKYPQGGEKQLIYALTKRKVKVGKLPNDVGAIVMNVGTIAAIYDAVYEGKPIIQRILTVAGSVKTPKNLLVRVGTPIENAINAAGKLLPTTKMLIHGGPMMGMAISRQDIPITKGSSGIVALELSAAIHEESSCIHCGRCIEACPMNLLPYLIDKGVRKNKALDNEQLGVMSCIECGACTWSCPAKRDLTHSCRVSKTLIRNDKTKQAQKEKGMNK